MNDKIKHLIAGFLIGVISSLLSWIVGWNTLLGIIPVILAAFGKEIVWDLLLDKGTFEGKDIWFTFWGGALGVIIVYGCYYFTL